MTTTQCHHGPEVCKSHAYDTEDSYCEWQYRDGHANTVALQNATPQQALQYKTDHTDRCIERAEKSNQGLAVFKMCRCFRLECVVDQCGHHGYQHHECSHPLQVMCLGNNSEGRSCSYSIVDRHCTRRRTNTADRYHADEMQATEEQQYGAYIHGLCDFGGQYTPEHSAQRSRRCYTCDSLFCRVRVKTFIDNRPESADQDGAKNCHV